jgi:hypothetical protein
MGKTTTMKHKLRVAGACRTFFDVLRKFKLVVKEPHADIQVNFILNHFGR